jgi:hypothetical protein
MEAMQVVRENAGVWAARERERERGRENPEGK